MTNLCKTLQDTYEIRDGHKVYDFDQCLDYITYQGKLHYGQCFRIETVDLPVVSQLLTYMIQDAAAAQAMHLDLRKGLLLTGPIGCGKTSLLHLMKAFASPTGFYKIKTCREVSFEFSKNGYTALSPYTQKQGYQNRLPGYCFDDLGAEQQIKHYGNECNVLAEILLSRYDHFIAQGCITHLTTNLSATEIEQYYGNRVRSRMREMFNLISFSVASRDKR
jgi:energy-coupling factor transporter ATP-binding protein EcfA2